MIKLIDSGVYYYNGEFVSEGEMTKRGIGKDILTVSYTHLTLPTTP